MKCLSVVLACLFCAAPSAVLAGSGPADSPLLRLHVFDCGELSFLDISAFGLSNADTDVRSMPGHTPGHQALLVHLRNTGPILPSGDLYHFRTSRRLRAVPTFNSNADQTLASMDKIERLIAETGAALWIEHDRALAETLELAPAAYD